MDPSVLTLVIKNEKWSENGSDIDSMMEEYKVKTYTLENASAFLIKLKSELYKNDLDLKIFQTQKH